MHGKKSWTEFRSTGLLWLINQTLHVFGWTIIIEVNDFDEVIDCYPARTKFRGFSHETQAKNYIAISEYMKVNCDELIKEAIEK